MMLPFTTVYLLGVFLVLLLRSFSQRGRAGPKLIVVSNITAGGNGKTPTVIWLAKHLIKKGLRVAIIASGYKAKLSSTPRMVNSTLPSDFAGDEACLIAKSLSADVYVCRDKALLYKHITKENKYDVCISDDGFSSLYLFADHLFWLSDAASLIGNGLYIPFGPLRYPLFFTRKGTKIVKNLLTNECAGFQYDSFQLKKSTDRSIHHTVNRVHYHLMTAVAKPDQVYASLQSIVKDLSVTSFRDHAHFDLPEAISHKMIVVTEKDWARLSFVAREDLLILSSSYKPNTVLCRLVEKLF